MSLPLVPAPLVSLDPLVLRRPTEKHDVEGDSNVELVVVPTLTRGTYSLPQGRDVMRAQERATQLDAILIVRLTADILEGDQVEVRGKVFDVVAIEDRRNRLAVHLRRVLAS